MENKFNWIDSPYSREILVLTKIKHPKLITIYKGCSVGFSQSNVGLVKVMNGVSAAPCCDINVIEKLGNIKL